MLEAVWEAPPVGTDGVVAAVAIGVPSTVWAAVPETVVVAVPEVTVAGPVVPDVAAAGGAGGAGVAEAGAVSPGWAGIEAGVDDAAVTDVAGPRPDCGTGTPACDNRTAVGAVLTPPALSVEPPPPEASGVEAVTGGPEEIAGAAGSVASAGS